MKLGFIGAGNMGSAIIKGILNKQALQADEIYLSRKHPEKSTEFVNTGIHVMPDNTSLVQAVDCIVLAIKPVYAQEVIDEIYEALNGPNTPLAVGEGMSLLSSHCTCTEEEFDFAQSTFSAAGKTVVVEDAVYTAANGISGCGPAFVYEFIEAMADGGVRYGVPRTLAYKLAAQTLIGAAKMVLETGEHPGKLKDAVCSPGGSTIEGVYALEKDGMRAAVMDAVGASIEKTLRMAH